MSSEIFTFTSFICDIKDLKYDFLINSDMKMDVDDEGTKSNDDSADSRSTEILPGDNTPESFEQNSIN